MKANFHNPSLENTEIPVINVTSLIDVTLTVLIMFILIAPIMEQGISLNLPQATAEKVKTKEALTIEVDRNGGIYLDTMPVTYIDLQRQLDSIASVNKDQSILIRADEGNKYGDIVQIIDLVKQSGFNKLGILTRAKEKEML